MAYLLDSDIVIDFLAEEPQTVTLVDTLEARGVFVSIIAYMETYQGVIEGGLTREDQDKFHQFFADVPVLPISPAVALRCAQVRADLKRRGRSVRRRALDLLIAATALTHGLTLVTHNTDDYKDISGLLRYHFPEP